MLKLLGKFVHISRRKKRQIHVHVHVKKRLIHVHDMKKDQFMFHVIHVHDIKKTNSHFKSYLEGDVGEGVINVRIQCGKKL